MSDKQGYLELSTSYQQRILRGELQVGERLPSVRELSRLHQVSLTTAQRAMARLQNDGYVESRGRHGCVVTDTWTTVPHAMIDSTRDNSMEIPQRIGLLVGWNPQQPGPVQPSFLALERILSTRVFGNGGALTHFVLSPKNPQSPEEIAREVIEASIDGIIVLVGSTAWRTRLAASLTNSGKSCIVFSTTSWCPDECDIVGVDDAWAISELTRRLVHMGHQRIAFLGYHPTSEIQMWNSVRLTAWRSTLASLGVSPDEASVHLVQRSVEVADVVASLCDYTAIVCSNDILAMRAVTALRAQGRRVPEDVTVTGYDNSPEDFVRCELTTVAVHEERVASTMLTLAANRKAGYMNFGDRACLLVRPVIIPRASWQAPAPQAR